MHGAGGVIPPQNDYFPRIREICDRYDVLLCADEVITGFGRTGRMFGLEHWGVQPDLMQYAKAITSGYFPLGGIGVSDEIADTMEDSGQPWMHAYTYSAHPVGCAVALATLDIIEGENFPAQAAEKGKRLLVGLKDALADHPNVGDIRGLGLMCGVEVVKDRATKAQFVPADGIGPKLMKAMISRNLFTRLKGEDVICLAPPIMVSNEILDDIVAIVRDSVHEVFGAG